MAKFVRTFEKTTLELTYAEVWKAWCERRHYFKTPVQVAAEKGARNLGIEKAAAVRSEPIAGGVLVTYYHTEEAVFAL